MERLRGKRTVEFLKNVRQGPDAPPGVPSRAAALRQLAVKFRVIGASRRRGGDERRIGHGVGMEGDADEKIFPEGANESYETNGWHYRAAAQFAYTLRGGFFIPASLREIRAFLFFFFRRGEYYMITLRRRRVSSR